MKNIIIAYPIKDVALRIRNLLESEGMYVSHICGTGASVLSIASDMRGGVIICASILRDTSAEALAEQLPAGFDIISLTKGGRENYSGNVISIPLPIDREDFIQTVRILVSSEYAHTQRSDTDSSYISNAKAILMEMNQMTEMQAHKHLQQLSMKHSKSMVEIAKEIVSSFN